jgi:hypothetical protein
MEESKLNCEMIWKIQKKEWKLNTAVEGITRYVEV